MESALLDSDFVCPLCGTEDVLLDSLTPVPDIKDKVDDYIKLA